jgi:hypothetical protein
VIAQTFNIERAIVRLETDSLTTESPPDQILTHKSVGRAASLTEDAFYERLKDESESHELGAKLRDFVDQVAELDVIPVYGASSLNLRWFPTPDHKMNFGSIRTDGRVNTDPANWVPDRLGHPEIGDSYQTEVAKLIAGGTVVRHPNGAQRSVKVDDKFVNLFDLLAAKDRWIQVMKNTQDLLADVVSQ